MKIFKIYVFSGEDITRDMGCTYHYQQKGATMKVSNLIKIVAEMRNHL